MKTILRICLTILCTASVVHAEGRWNDQGKARHPSFYYGVDLTYGNIYTFAVSSCFIGVLNYLINDTVFENGYEYVFHNVSPDSNFKKNSLTGVKFNDLFNNFQGGIKLGYRTDFTGFTNIGLYGSAHYRLDNYLLSSDSGTGLASNRADRIIVGANLLLILGKIDSNFKVTAEAGLRYSLGINYKSPYGHDLQQINNGFISHYAVKFSGPSLLQNLGVFVDISHFNLLNEGYISNGILPYENMKFKPVTLGITWTITPHQALDRL